MNQKKNLKYTEDQKLVIQGMLTETIDDGKEGFHSFSPIQEVFGYPELKELNSDDEE